MKKIAFYDTKDFSQSSFEKYRPNDLSITYFEHKLTPDTVASAAGFDAVCIFVHDIVDDTVAKRLAAMGIRLIALRCAGYNNVNLEACAAYGITVTRVPSYSPPSIAEHSVALMLVLSRHLVRAHARVREGNFSLNGMVGFEMHNKTAGIIGTGRIGRHAAEILTGFHCKVLAFDPYPDEELRKNSRIEYTDLDTIFAESDIISLYVPLLPSTKYMINDDSIAKMKQGVMLINTSRGALVDTKALIRGLKTGKIACAGLDVYEEESEYFYEDKSDGVITDDVLARLLTFNNVLVTSHQAFLTHEALQKIAEITYNNIQEYFAGKRGHSLTYGLCSQCA
ncbi:MAG: 2-hydroxyacid dehydrogenase [Candidatus Hydrogenedentales bacterium]|jgi:D-lactate dehydrogenase